ncbi:MAG: hypothetical protein HUU46_17875 [Candidatus Hydrogenedentes bacterium]|nr:hypothetical protein [Candidatus Hydrogenedentota bacterium]
MNAKPLRKMNNVMRWVLPLIAVAVLVAAPNHGAVAGDNKVEDGSFEAGRNSGFWKEKSTNFGTPICIVSSPSEVPCGDGEGTALPRTGVYWAWFGGADTFVEKGSLTQNVKFPSGGSAKLRFYLWIGDSSPDGKDSLTVLVDGQKVFKVKENNTGYSSYTLVQKNLDQFADGQRHKVQFKNRCTGDGNSNMSVDDISITAD